MKQWSCIVVGILVLMTSQVASAQFLPGISEITGFGGVAINGEDKTTFGAAITVNVTTHLGLEGEIGMLFGDKVDDIININLDMVLNLGTGASLVVPYIVGGAGVLNNGGTDIALNAGAGFKVFVEPSIALRLDFRAFLTTEGGDVHDMERFYGGVHFLF